MAALNWKRKVILFKAEVTYGTDPVPVAATDAVLARNVNLTPLVLVTDPRAVELPFAGNQGQIIAGQSVKLEFEVEMQGAGAAGTKAPYGPMLLACGMSETLNAGISAAYALVAPSAATSGTAYFYMGGRLHSIVGCLGDPTFTWSRGKVPTIKFAFMGLYVGPTDVALPAPTLTPWKLPLAVNNVNTTPFTLHGFAGKFTDLTITFGNVMSYRNIVGSEAIRFTDRKLTGTVKLEDELVATKDWWTIIKGATTGALALTHGTVAGSIVAAAAPAIQLTSPALAADENISVLSMNMDLLPSAAGNDEFTFTVK
jgi:hypothetical protein